MHTRLPILSLLEGGDRLTVLARAGQVKHPDGFVVTCPDVASLPVNCDTVGGCDLICCIVGSVHASETACTCVPQVYGMSLQQLGAHHQATWHDLNKRHHEHDKCSFLL